MCYEEEMAHDEIVRKSWEKVHDLFNLSSGPLSPRSGGSPFQLFDPPACEVLLNDIPQPDGTQSNFGGGLDTPPPILEGPPTFGRETQVTLIRSCDQVTEVERLVTCDNGVQHSPVRVSREVQTYIPRTVSWTQTQPTPTLHDADAGSTDGVQHRHTKLNRQRQKSSHRQTVILTYLRFPLEHPVQSSPGGTATPSSTVC